MYHSPLSTQESGTPGVNWFMRLSRIHALQEIGQAYDCENVVWLHIDNVLSVHRKVLLELCINYPANMLDAAVTLRLGWMFKEAGAHMIRSNKVIWAEAQEKLEELEIAELLQIKRLHFINHLKGTEATLLKMTVGSGNNADEAVEQFRHWFTIALRSKQGSGLADDYATVYHKIAEGSISALKACSSQRDPFALGWMPPVGQPSHNDLIGTNDKARGGGARDADRNELERLLCILLNRAKLIMKDILVVKTFAEDERVSPNDLKFMDISERDIPWLKIRADVSMSVRELDLGQGSGCPTNKQAVLGWVRCLLDLVSRLACLVCE